MVECTVAPSRCLPVGHQRGERGHSTARGSREYRRAMFREPEHRIERVGRLVERAVGATVIVLVLWLEQVRSPAR